MDNRVNIEGFTPADIMLHKVRSVLQQFDKADDVALLETALILTDQPMLRAGVASEVLRRVANANPTEPELAETSQMMATMQTQIYPNVNATDIKILLKSAEELIAFSLEQTRLPCDAELEQRTLQSPLTIPDSPAEEIKIIIETVEHVLGKRK